MVGRAAAALHAAHHRLGQPSPGGGIETESKPRPRSRTVTVTPPSVTSAKREIWCTPECLAAFTMASRAACTIPSILSSQVQSPTTTVSMRTMKRSSTSPAVWRRAARKDGEKRRGDLVDVAAQLPLLAAGQGSHLARVVGRLLQQGQGLQHRVVEVGGDLGPVVRPAAGGPLLFQGLQSLGAVAVVAAQGGDAPPEGEGGDGEAADVPGHLGGGAGPYAASRRPARWPGRPAATRAGPGRRRSRPPQEAGQGVAAEEEVLGAGDEGGDRHPHRHRPVEDHPDRVMEPAGMQGVGHGDPGPGEGHGVGAAHHHLIGPRVGGQGGAHQGPHPDDGEEAKADHHPAQGVVDRGDAPPGSCAHATAFAIMSLPAGSPDGRAAARGVSRRSDACDGAYSRPGRPDTPEGLSRTAV